MSAFYALALGAATLPPAPDTTITTAPVPRLIKLGTHGLIPGVFTLGYERQLSAQWSVLGSVGYYGSSYESFALIDNGGGYVQDDYMRRDRYYAVGTQLRHYFRRRHPKPLTGWFAGANLQATQHNSNTNYLKYPQNNASFHRASIQVQVLAGRQCALGRRLILDSFLGVSVWRPPSPVGGTQSVQVQAGAGLQVGYRFQPLPRP
ncbi:DUF3575 domain-containing protein [Hymenobacter sp. BT190]|uniref:DUF3575 domain-containing protein n=1 Tax=Hymenobacter sp. BT190 TaxID=2763505 RepID=UPI0016518D80|nr:DUF3575 domain-containing protein [Hymenobacter sp. BT190]MBC6697908.1 DUF3575 domain-containing protein [Hymenobacter sp. BT190]